METSLQPHGGDQETIIQLIRGILQDTLALFSKELTAAKLEIQQEVTKALASGVWLAIGGFLLALGFVLVSLMFVFILTSYSSLPLWASLGIVGIVYLVLGGVVIWAGAHRAREVKPLPQQSIESTKQDVRYIAGQRTDHSQTAEKAL